MFVTKTRIFPKAPLPEDTFIRHRPEKRAPYISGKLHAISLQSVLARGGNLDDIAQWASPWISFLSGKVLPGNGFQLPGEYIDAISANLLMDESGKWVYFDAEWLTDVTIPLKWILIRGLVNAVSLSPLSPALAGLTYRDLVKGVLSKSGYEITAEDMRTAANLENRLQQTVLGSMWKGPEYSDLLSSQIRSYTFSTLKDELDRVKSTFSWQITKPLRFLAYLFRRIKKLRSD
jgi:hypothetical protein